MAETLLGLGGNVGMVRDSLARAVAMLCDDQTVHLIARSSDFSTPPWGVMDQPDFVNLCLLAETALTPHALLNRTQAIERAFGRDRAGERRFGPRPLDIDILTYDDIVLVSAELTLPHPHIFDRAFVLAPLAEIVPERVIAGRRVRDALATVDVTGIQKLNPHRG